MESLSGSRQELICSTKPQLSPLIELTNIDLLRLQVLDYQMGLIGQPIGDICYFLYVNTDREFRRKHLDNCLKWYFDVFGSYLTTIDFRD